MHTFLLILVFLLRQQPLHICIVDLRLQARLGKWAQVVVLIDMWVCDYNACPSLLNKLGNTWLAVAQKVLHGGGSVWQPLSYREISMTTPTVEVLHYVTDDAGISLNY